MAQDLNLYIVHDRTQIGAAVVYLREYPGDRIAALDFWVERELAERSIPFISCAGFGSSGRPQDMLSAARTIAREWYRLSSMGFFAHKGIRIGEAIEPMFDFYLQRFFYYTGVLGALAAAHPGASLIVPHMNDAMSDTVGPLAPFEGRAVADAAGAVARANGTKFRLLGTEPPLPARHVYPKQRSLLLLRAYNACMSLVPRGSRQPVFASEYWHHIAPLLAQGRPLALTLMDRGEARHIPYRQLLRHRIRLLHPSDMAGVTRTGAAAKAAEFRSHWEGAREDVASFVRGLCGNEQWEALAPAFDYAVGVYAERIVADIEGLRAILADGRIKGVMLRASIGGRQPHFFLAARVARVLGIPSVEIQHAAAVFDPQSVHSRLEASYLAAYGTFEQELYARNGYAPERILPIGSPRFDAYLSERLVLEKRRDETLRELGLGKGLVLFAAVPAEQPGLSALDFSSYDIARLFRDYKQLKDALPELQIIFRFRNAQPEAAAYVRELFPEGGVAVSQGGPVLPILCASDIACTGNSTLLYEALIAEVPVVLFPWKAHDPHISLYAPVFPHAPDAPALIAEVRTLLVDSSRAEALRRQDGFLKRHSFDGGASKRLSELLHSLPSLSCKVAQ